MADWYHLTRTAVTDRGGGVLFTYHASLEDALKAIYPDFNWESERFPAAKIVTGRVPSRYWKDKRHLFEALQRAEQVLGIKRVTTLTPFLSPLYPLPPLYFFS